MNRLGKALEGYLSVRRALGYKLRREGMLLPGFVAYLESQGSAFITTQWALRWAMLPADVSAYWSARRLGLVRGFAKHVRAFDPRTEVPSANLIPYQRPRITPYLYTDADIRALLEACQRLRGPLMSATYETLFGLLAATGMRVGEAIGLDRSDFNEHEELLVVRHGKFDKSREVLLHSTTIEALRAYARKRDHVVGRRKSPGFFLSQAGTRLFAQNVWRIFARLRRWAGLPLRPRPPRIHDLRHSFAVHTLLRWYRAGVDVEPRMAVLSTYLGHVSPSTTYWYLTAAPELMGLAAQRLEDALGELP